MRQDKLTASSVACVLGLFICWQTLENYAENGLTFKEWVVGVLAGVVVGGGTGRLGYMAVRRFNPGDDDE
jgi:hypothetical protein